MFLFTPYLPYFLVMRRILNILNRVLWLVRSLTKCCTFWRCWILRRFKLKFWLNKNTRWLYDCLLELISFFLSFLDCLWFLALTLFGHEALLWENAWLIMVLLHLILILILIQTTIRNFFGILLNNQVVRGLLRNYLRDTRPLFFISFLNKFIVVNIQSRIQFVCDVHVSRVLYVVKGGAEVVLARATLRHESVSCLCLIRVHDMVDVYILFLSRVQVLIDLFFKWGLIFYFFERFLYKHSHLWLWKETIFVFVELWKLFFQKRWVIIFSPFFVDRFWQFLEELEYLSLIEVSIAVSVVQIPYLVNIFWKFSSVSLQKLCQQTFTFS